MLTLKYKVENLWKAGGKGGLVRNVRVTYYVKGLGLQRGRCVGKIKLRQLLFNVLSYLLSCS